MSRFSATPFHAVYTLHAYDCMCTTKHTHTLESEWIYYICAGSGSWEWAAHPQPWGRVQLWRPDMRGAHQQTEEEGDEEEGWHLAVACRLALRNKLHALHPRPRTQPWCKCWQPRISPMITQTGRGQRGQKRKTLFYSCSYCPCQS